MILDNFFPKRKQNRLKDYDYSSCGAYFITICTNDKRNIFWKQIVGEDIILPPSTKHINVPLSEYGKIVDKAINNIDKIYKNAEVLHYVIMPNHVHLILLLSNGRILSSPTSISTIIGQMKRYSAKVIAKPIWQRSFHDHIIRNEKDYEELAKYIYENPIKWKDDCFYFES